MRRCPERLSSSSVQRLRDHDPKVTPALVWLEQRLAAQGTTADTIVHDEHQRQGSSNVTVPQHHHEHAARYRSWTGLSSSRASAWSTNAARGLRLCADGLCDTQPLPRGHRGALEGLALTEMEIARAALAAAGTGTNVPDRHRDPGYHLIAAGRREFEIMVGYRAEPWRWPARWLRSHGAPHYIGAILLVAACVMALPLFGLQTLAIGGASLGVSACSP
jgi:cyclic beta-1,2-glucan synthetase